MVTKIVKVTKFNWYGKMRKQIRQPNANLSHTLWDMIKFSATNLSQNKF